MIRKSRMWLYVRGRNPGVIVLTAALVLLFSAPADAIDLLKESGKYTLSLDTTLSWGARYRMEDIDPAIVSHHSGGTAWSGNGDDGNLNFEKGSIVSNTAKATIDLSFSATAGQHSFGFFARGSGFYDFALENSCCARTELTQDALDWAGSRVELLDAYAWWQFPFGEIRVGQQVLNWGESTFIQGGLSGINPVDVSALRVPGAELREAFRPLGMVWASVNASQNVAFEGFYEYDWEPIVVDPPGTYFSTNDFVGPGGEDVFLAFDTFPDTGVIPPFIPPDLAATIDYPFMSVSRTDTVEPDNGGQYGLALRLYLPKLGGTELGFFFTNLHSRLPTVNGVTGPVSIVPDVQAAGAATALYYYYLAGVPPGVDPVVDATAAAYGQAAGTAVYANSAAWYTAYPEDIKTYGLSWNAELGTTGLAFQGEFAYHQDQPLQADDVELLFAALSPISAWLAESNQLYPGGVGFSEDVIGYKRLDTSQLQFTLTKIYAQFLGADQAVFLGEFGFNWVYDMPSKDELRFDGPGTYTSGNPLQELPGGAHTGKPYELPEHFADDFSWGYRLAGKLLYNNAIGAWSLAPRFAWQQDVSGVSPGPGGPFLEGFKAFTIGISADYQNSWEVDLSYTMYTGAGRWNLINDRDFIGGFVRYSF